MLRIIGTTWAVLFALAVPVVAQQGPPPEPRPPAGETQQMTPDEAVQRAQALRQAGRAGEALDLLRTVLKTARNNVEANLLTAEMLMDGNDYDLARNYFKQVLDNEPSNFRANLGTGKIWIANHYWRQASSYLEKAENVAPASSRSEVKRLLATAYTEMGLMDKGIEKAVEAVQADPNDLDALQTLVQIRRAAITRDPKAAELALADADKYIQRAADALAHAPLDRAALTRLSGAYDCLYVPPPAPGAPATGVLKSYLDTFYERSFKNEVTDTLLPGKGVDSAAVLMRIAEVLRQRALVALIDSECDALLLVEGAVSNDYDPKNVKNWEHLLVSYQQLQDLLARLVGPAVYSDATLPDRAVAACRKILEIDPQNERAQQYLRSAGVALTTQPATTAPANE